MSKEIKRQQYSEKRLRYLLVDGQNLLYRGYFAGKHAPVKEYQGVRNPGAFNVMRSIAMLTRKFSPDRVIVCWDKGKCEARKKIFPEYKAHRDKNRDPLDSKLILQNKLTAQKIIKPLPIIQIERQGIEADDIIGYLSSRLRGTKIVISQDRDFIQLIKPGTNLYFPIQKRLLNKKNIDKYLGFPKDRYLLYKAIVGDPSDNINGIRGMGDKRTTKLMSGTEDEIKLEKDWLPIIERNLELMNIGLILKEPDIDFIEKKYVQQRDKNINFDIAKRMMKRENFSYITKNFNMFRRSLSALR